jgi:hypothetical protein
MRYYDILQHPMLSPDNHNILSSLDLLPTAGGVRALDWRGVTLATCLACLGVAWKVDIFLAKQV